ncbi:leukotriene B4 receptor 1-like [Centroberyx gerrardi]|uniref:leukotriene B4 receptor 1-like n=1 Tax=Centroberyx gerrardi TaxID=166262 RepID=UPI003AB0F550
MEQLNFTTNASNISSTLGHPLSASWHSRGPVPGVVLSLCFLLGVPGNIAVIVFLGRNRQQLSSLSCSLMLNLAVSDLLCLITLPLWIYALLYKWTLGLVACKVLTYLLYCSVCSSFLTVTALSIQRYLQVVYMQMQLDLAGQRGILVLLWMVGMILSMPELVVRQLVHDENWISCQAQYSSRAQHVAFLLTETLLGFVLFSIVVFAYIRLHKRVNGTAFFNNPRMTRLVTGIIVTFFLLWMPYHIVNVLEVAAILLRNEDLLKFCMENWRTVGALTFVNSCLDPLLYAFASRNVCTTCRNV